MKLANNVIAGNGHDNGTPGVDCRETGDSDHLVVNNIFWDNAGGDSTGATCTLTGNAHTDPLLVAGDWHLFGEQPSDRIRQPDVRGATRLRRQRTGHRA